MWGTQSEYPADAGFRLTFRVAASLPRVFAPRESLQAPSLVEAGQASRREEACAVADDRPLEALAASARARYAAVRAGCSVELPEGDSADWAPAGC